VARKRARECGPRMSEQSASPIGTVAQEAARLIEDMVTMARLSYRPGSNSGNPSDPGDPGGPGGPGEPDDPSRYPAASPENSASPNGQAEAATKGDRQPLDHESLDHETQGSGAADKTAEGVCSQCGADRADAAGDNIPLNCRLCPLCRGIGLLRSVRPETVDLLADLAMSVAAGLREVALWSRASEPASSATSTSGGPADPDRAPVQDIPVDDESEG
jgi:hypothetical protein